MSTEEPLFARARLAAGALFVRGDEVLLVHKVYGNGWDIPGGYVEPGESPTDACHREVLEELGIDRPPVRLLALDWAPTPTDGDKILFVFDCGGLGDEQQVTLQLDELDQWQWVHVDELADYTIPRLTRRLRHAHAAHKAGRTVFLENGEIAL
jgi:8-oxo-dGTP diphosphatase